MKDMRREDITEKGHEVEKCVSGQQSCRNPLSLKKDHFLRTLI